MSSGSSGVQVRGVFIGAGCNRVVNNVSWGASGFVSFGAQNAVAIFCPKTAQILTTLPGHKASVNCTYWLPSSKFAFRAEKLKRHYLLSGDADGVIILWEFSLHDGKWAQVLQVPESHRKGVTCITGFMFSENEALIASTSSDGKINIWDVVFPSANEGSCTLAHIDSISVGSKPMVALSMAELPGNTGQVVLAMGGLDNKVHLNYGSRSGKFSHACELKGHTDWIRSLDFSLPVSLEGEKESLLLVSSSQDKGIRIWKISSHSSPPDTNVELSLLSYIEGPLLVVGSTCYQISLESLLVGHEDWAYSVQWQPPVDSSGASHQPLSLLSASMDKTMMIWQPERTTGIWMNVVTVGELSHCALGFYGGHWSPSGQSILAHGYGGSFHMWRNVGSGSDDWQPQMVPSGHFAAVSDISWARSGEYILSVSHDQTTRVFARWKNSSQSFDPWHEIARPQVHGHDINCITIIRGKGNHRFVSGADEKVSRVFEAPLSFLKTLNQLTSQACTFPENDQPETRILGANMSALGLSQKPIYVHATNETSNKSGTATDGFDTLESVPDAVPVVLTKPPVEEQLAWHTLWPETHKLYGHGNELYSLCCNHEGTLIASSCKAQSATVAEIWLWQVGTWKAVGRLHSHNLTVTQMEFSHDDGMLLAVSRDRKFSVFSIKRKGSDGIDYQLLAMQEAHKRIIWACSWNPFGHEFATSSRDKTVKIWSVLEKSSVVLLTSFPQFSSSVTALSWLGLDRHKNRGLLAIGMESGLIELWNLTVEKPGEVDKIPEVSAALAVRLDPFFCHVSTVNRLAWLNPYNTDNCNIAQLASCGADHCVRIFEVNVNYV